MIGPENLHHFLDQSESNLKLDVLWSLAFSRASIKLRVLSLSSHWFFDITSFHLIGCCFGFGFTTLNRKALCHFYSNWFDPGVTFDCANDFLGKVSPKKDSYR